MGGKDVTRWRQTRLDPLGTGYKWEVGPLDRDFFALVVGFETNWFITAQVAAGPVAIQALTELSAQADQWLPPDARI